jgi:hypothetical protein
LSVEASGAGGGEKISWMQPSKSRHALAAAISTASALDLTVADSRASMSMMASLRVQRVDRI